MNQPDAAEMAAMLFVWSMRLFAVSTVFSVVLLLARAVARHLWRVVVFRKKRKPNG